MDTRPPTHPLDTQTAMAMEDGQWKFQAADGISYSYSNESNAWFVTVPDDLLKAQQSIYGVHGVDESIPERPLKRKTRDPKPKEEKKQEIKNTAVYVSGVPEDATIAEMIEVFKRGGLFFTDPTTGLPKIKLYADINGKLKGDALVMYLREESVALACDLIDDTKFRDDEPGKILVQPAEFKTKDPSEIKEAGPTVDKRKKQKAMEKLNRQLLWDEDAQVSAKKDKHSKMVVLKHMFTKKELESSPALILDLKSEVRQECEKLDFSLQLEDEGIMTVRFKDESAALECVQLMHGRFYAGERIVAIISDGKERFRISKNDDADSQKKRQDAYNKWLENEPDAK